MSMNFGEGVLYSVLGMLVVFFGLICLEYVIKLISVANAGRGQAEADAKAAEYAASAPVPASPSASAPAPGSAGDIKLYGTPDRDAAMIMAVTADKLGKPLNELRFKSIREVK
jgi:Na+-transporting methylmalonyl-CoA/oxaloacetate decarboxylase gamma subunit